MSESSVWTRRREWPAFGERMEGALEEAEVVLEFRLATFGNNVGAGVSEAAETEEGTVAWDSHSGQSPVTVPSPLPPFDPEFALRFLKWREEKRRGRGRRGRGGLGRRQPSIEEVRDDVIRRVRAIRRHREKFGTPEERPDGEGRDRDGHS